MLVSARCLASGAAQPLPGHHHQTQGGRAGPFDRRVLQCQEGEGLVLHSGSLLFSLSPLASLGISANLLTKIKEVHLRR